MPVAGADRIMLTEQIAVMDLIALGRFALLPEDDLNLAALLRSPLAFSEEELFALCHARKGTSGKPWTRASEEGFRPGAFVPAECWRAPITCRRLNSTPMH